jgi:phosphatidylinositol dimannoside acyltransferase
MKHEEPPTASASVSETLAALAYTTAWRTVRVAPEPVARHAFRTLADQVWMRRAGGVPTLEDNLLRVLTFTAQQEGLTLNDDRLREVSREAVRSYLQYWCDVFRLPSMSPERVLERVTIDHADRISGAAESGRGAVVVLPHAGNWDLMGAWLAQTFGPFTTVAERLRPESLHRRFVDYRTSLGMEVLPLTGEGHVFAQLAARLRRGGVVCLLGDRDLTGSGVEVDFFGAPARFPAGPAALAVATGAALLPVEVWVDIEADQHVTGVIHEELPLPSEGPRKERIGEGTQRVAHAFQEFIGAHPQDWHMMQPIWRGAPGEGVEQTPKEGAA